MLAIVVGLALAQTSLYASVAEPLLEGGNAAWNAAEEAALPGLPGQADAVDEGEASEEAPDDTEDADLEAEEAGTDDGSGDEGDSLEAVPSPVIPAPAPSPETTATLDPAEAGSITGLLWADGSGKALSAGLDGLHGSDEAALAGYTVYLYAADSLAAPIDAAITGADGAYVFAGLVPGSYVLGVASETIDGVQYLPPMRATSDNMFVIDVTSSPLMSYTAVIVLAAGQEVAGIDAGMRLPMATQALAGNSYTIDVNYNAGSLTATGRGYTFNSPKLTFDASSTGNTYTIIRTGTGGGAVSSIEFAAGANPASVSFNNFNLTGGITFAAGFNAAITFNNVSLGDTSLTLPTGFNAALGINGLTVNKLTLPSDYADPITFNGITATGGIAYPTGYNEPITIASDFSVQGNQFPTGYTGPVTIGGGTFTKRNLICRPGTSLPVGASGIFLPANITAITIKDAATSSSGTLRLALGGVDANREFTLLVAGSSDITGSIEAPSGTLLTIDSADAPGTKSEDGTLAVTAPDSRAAIGGGTGSSGQVTINGATVVATSNDGAGIGGGRSYVGNVTVNGGNVTALALGDGAGIGGGAGVAGVGNVTITDGIVDATSKGDGAGIGGGSSGVGNVTITGGTVTATSGNHDTILQGNGTGDGAGIGGGIDSYGNVIITDGHVTANSIFGAGIGNGGTNNDSPGGATQGNVTITGGDIRGYSLNGASIGRGCGESYVPTYEIEKEADILMYGRGYYSGRFGIQCSGTNQGDAYYVSMYFNERIRGDLYVCEASDTMSLVRVLPIDKSGIIYMSVTFSTGHAYSEDFEIFMDYYNDQQAYMGLRSIVHYYDHLPSGSFLHVKDPIIPSVRDMGSYPANYPNATADVLFAYMDIGGAPPLFFRVTERYVDTEGNPLPDPSNPPSYTKDETAVLIDPHDSYGKAIPDVSGYRPCGYFIGDAFDPTADAYTPGTSLTVGPVTESFTVYFVYSAAADFSFHKVDEKGGPLAGVYFALYSCTAAEDDPQHVHDSLAQAGSCWGDPVGAMSAQDGLVSFAGLEPGDYMLVEVETLPGYQLPHGQWLVEFAGGDLEAEITAHGTGDMLPPAFKVGTGSQEGALLLPNYREMTMPPAGGAGVLALTIVGTVLIGAGVVCLSLPGARKKRDQKRPLPDSDQG